ncbi:hypothetical protein NPIL_610041 [Nephila pilipes]|uniref:Uncharacterized protein n=1 Tax=Nephila pilipes TaxID=299642 RepID=A0A8X6TW22_NEPPI|nr:hypothetical protein NPIL_610041 [Nephila pilipes]
MYLLLQHRVYTMNSCQISTHVKISPSSSKICGHESCHTIYTATTFMQQIELSPVCKLCHQKPTIQPCPNVITSVSAPRYELGACSGTPNRLSRQCLRRYSE